MKFDENDITDIETLENEAEAKAYILFLESEKRRHVKDIFMISERIRAVKERFGGLE